MQTLHQPCAPLALQEFISGELHIDRGNQVVHAYPDST